MAEIESIKEKIKGLIVERLKFHYLTPDQIKDDAPLFKDDSLPPGEGLGMDSLDALELVIGLEQEFGIFIEDDPAGRSALASVTSLAHFIKQELERRPRSDS